jgi:endonuclease/exonuclease/phosphatase family metal-dependent hydrolase
MRLLIEKTKKLSVAGLMIAFQLLATPLIAQTDSVYWSFGTPGTAVATATSSSNANVAATSCIADTGNVCCAFGSASGYSTLYFTTQFPSSGYTGASGEPTLRNNAKTGSFNAATSTYFSFTVTPNTGYAVNISGISFAGLKNATGPTGYTIRTSADGYSTTVGTGSLTTSYGSSKKTHTGLSISGAASTPITVRVYTHNPIVTNTGGNVFLDDIMIYYTTTLISACTTPPASPSGLAVSGITFYDAFVNWNSTTSTLSYEYAVTTSATPPSSGTNTADTFSNATGLTGNTLYYVHVRSKCDAYASGWTTTSFTTDTIPVCDTPVNLAATNISFNGADINWYPISGADGYEYALNTSATPPSFGTFTTSTTYLASGLTDNSSYYFHLRTVCVDDHLYSNWITLHFNTLEDTTTDTFTVVTYNLLNFSGSGRETYYRTIMDSIRADLVVVQELSGGSTSFNNFRNNVLNYYTSLYSGATFNDGPDTDNGLYYKSSKFQFISNTPISTSLRDISQFKIKHIPSGDTLIIYSVHLKASSGTSEEAQRAAEVDALRAVTDGLHSGSYFLVCGDFNIYKSSESAYQKLIGTGSNANGKFNDLLSLSGTWNNSSYAIHHTQSPRTTSFGGGATGGLDDRFDMLLFSTAIVQAGGFNILSNSYKAYGNDGQHYNQALNTAPYTMYSSTIASAIHDASDHLPVVVKLTYSLGSPKGASTVSIADVTDYKPMLTVYPNPAETILFIKANGIVSKPVSLNLYDLSGRIVKQVIAVTLDKEIASINLSGLAAGVYYLKAVNMNEVHKIIIK